MRRKILFILHLPPPVHGAAMVGEYIRNSRLINQAIESQYINLSTSTSLSEIGRNGLWKAVKLFKIQYRLVLLLMKKDFDLCYMTLTSHGAGFYKDILIVATLKLFRKKIVYHLHNKGVSNRQDNYIDNLLYRFAFKDTNTILLSKYLYSDISKYVLPENVHYCPNGIPDLSHPIKDKQSDKSSSLDILFLSNMMEEKGVWILLEACFLLKQRGVDFICNFIGAWSDIQEKEFNDRLDSLDLVNHVIMHGKKYNEEKALFFQKADIFAFPTFYHNEAFSLVVLEAMQHGLPIVSTDEGGLLDMVVDGETGFIVNKKDSLDLANKIQYLYNHPELREKMGVEGKRKFTELYTIQHFEENFARILQFL